MDQYEDGPSPEERENRKLMIGLVIGLLIGLLIGAIGGVIYGAPWLRRMEFSGDGYLLPALLAGIIVFLMPIIMLLKRTAGGAQPGSQSSQQFTLVIGLLLMFGGLMFAILTMLHP